MVILVKCTSYTYLPFTRACSLVRFLSSDANSLYQCNSKITNCFKYGDITTALNVFDGMPIKNIVTWNCMISGYVKNGKICAARQVFENMPSRNVVSWTAMLNGYAKCGRLDEARSLFDAIADKNVVCWNAMLSGYVKNRRILEAKRVFDEMPDRNSVSWATIIEGCFNEGLVDEAEKLFNACPVEAVLVNNAMLSGYDDMGDLESLWELFTVMCELDVASWTTVIRCFTRFGKMEKARSLFEEMPSKDIVAWTVMIRGYLQNNQIEEARTLFYKMPSRDIVAYNSMIGGYVKNGKLEEALELFWQMPKQNIVSWNTILQGYAQEYDMHNAQIFFHKIPNKDRTTWNIMICGYQNEEAFGLYNKMMQSGIKPDQVTFASLISVCGSLAVHGWGKAIHLCLIKYAYDNDSVVISSLISMYSKCGFMNDANLVFEMMTEKDTVSWNAMIVAKAHHGSVLEALELYFDMKKAGFQPDHLTFLGLLTAFSHSGVINESWKFFKSMKKDSNLRPKAEHYACMIDILGRSGMLYEAYELAKQLPVDLPSYTWETLLSYCKVHENFELGEVVAQKLSNLQRLNGGMCVLRSNIYASRGMWEDAANMRTLLAHRGMKKELAYSWIEMKGQIFRFVYNDSSHAQLDEIHNALETLSAVMEEYG